MSPQIIGIFIKIFSVSVVVLLGVAVKTFPDEAPVSQLVFFRVVFALPFVLAFCYFQQGRDWARTQAKLKPKRLSLHFRRSFLGMTSMALIFLSVRYLPLPIAQSIRELQPVGITLLAALLLGERIRIFRTIGLFFGLIGVAIIVYQMVTGDNHFEHFSDSDLRLGVIFALLSVLTTSLAQIQIRSMVASESPEAIVFFFFVFTAMISIFFLPFGWVWPSVDGWKWIMMIGFLGAIGQLSLTIAYKYAEASMLAPFEYFSIPLSILIGGMFFDEWPRAVSLIGIVFILLGGLIIIFREGQLAQKRESEAEGRAP